MKSSELIRDKREQIIQIIARYPVKNPKVFGSVAKGTDTEVSDIDILVDTMPTTSLFHLGGLHEDFWALVLMFATLETSQSTSVIRCSRRHVLYK